MELTERTESTVPEDREWLVAELEAERAERQRLTERLEAEQQQGFWFHRFDRS